MSYIRPFPFGILSRNDFIAPFAIKSDIYLGAHYVSKLGFDTVINNFVTLCQVNSTLEQWQWQAGLWVNGKNRLRLHG